jgi:hypothetical protein
VNRLLSEFTSRASLMEHSLADGLVIFLIVP